MWTDAPTTIIIIIIGDSSINNTRRDVAKRARKSTKIAENPWLGLRNAGRMEDELLSSIIRFDLNASFKRLQSARLSRATTAGRES